MQFYVTFNVTFDPHLVGGQFLKHNFGPLFKSACNAWSNSISLKLYKHNFVNSDEFYEN